MLNVTKQGREKQMSKKGFYGVVLVVVAVLAGCAMTPEYARDIEVAAEAAPQVDLKGYSRYGWYGAGAVLVDEEGRWEPPSFDVDSEIRFLVDSQLRGKGLTEDSVKPDLLMVMTLGVNMDALKTLKVDKEEHGVIRNVPSGALVLMLVDASTSKPVWIGAARADVKQGLDEATVKARLKYAVERVFSDYPSR